MKEIELNLGRLAFVMSVPDQAEILRMGKSGMISNPEEKIRDVLNNPVGCQSLKELVKGKLDKKPGAKAVIVISDITRPVPYSGEAGILYPIVEEMRQAGLPSSRILILVATGTHRAMSEKELREFLDPRVFELGLPIINHDCRNQKDLIKVGKTEIGGEIFLNRHYMEREIRILTGLVESHFMAGVSGGRKSICPGLLAEDSTNILHGGPILSSSRASDLILDGNPVHEEALCVAKMAGCDMIVNVTLDRDYRLTGIFAGDLEAAHLGAVKKLRTYAAIPVQKKYDIVFTHAGFVGVNHYQAAKGALVCVPLVKENGICILAARHTDADPIGRDNYKEMIQLLSKLGSEKFLQEILDPSWTFVPDQWEAQMWTRLLKIIPPENLIYCSLEIPEDNFSWLPGRDGRSLAPEASTLKEVAEKALGWAVDRMRRQGREPEIAILPDGPYGIPVLEWS